MKYSDHLEYLQKIHDMLPEGHSAIVACIRAEYDCYCLDQVRESCVGRIQERMNSSAAADKEYCEAQRAQIGKIVQLMDGTVDDVRNLVKKDFFLKFIDQDDKYVLDCNPHSFFDFVLYVYNPYEGAHEKVLRFDIADVSGLRELILNGQIVDGYALINDYFKSKLGFVPDYEVI